VALCGRLIPSKRFELGLECISAVGASAVVIGDGPERGSLESRARRLGLDARFVGQLPRPAALGALRRADVLLHPSRAEGAPTVVREARALGLAVVCSDAGDLLRWAADDAGIVVAADVDLAAALQRVLRSSRSGPHRDPSGA
jgi:glycosyltransferase involved in cell wall biosynthesis